MKKSYKSTHVKEFVDFNSSFLKTKKIFSLDKHFSTKEDMWNEINDAVHRKFPKLQNTEGHPGFTNGYNKTKVQLSDFSSVNKTVKVNGELVDFDYVINHVFKLLKKDRLFENVEYNSKDYNKEFKKIADELERLQVNFGVNLDSLTIKQFIDKSKHIKSDIGI